MFSGDTPLEITALQKSRDDWLNETVEEAPITDDATSKIEETLTENVDEVVAEEVSSIPVQESPVIIEKPIVTDEQPTADAEINYTIQVAAEPNADAAEQNVGRLIDAGYEAYSLEHTTANNKILYRIRIGKYATRDDALQAADKIANDRGLPTWVTQYQK